MMDWNPTPVEEKISLKFKHPEGLFLALSHPSYAKQINAPEENNERLVVLGGMITQGAIADYLYHRCPYLQVANYKGLLGKLTEPDRLTKVWFQLGLGDAYPFLVLTEKRAILRQKQDNPFVDGFYALVGAIQLDRGFAQTSHWLEKHLIAPLLERYLKDETERVDGLTQVKFLGTLVLNAIAADYLYHRLPGVPAKRYQSFQKDLLSKGAIAGYKDKLQSETKKGFKQQVGEVYEALYQENPRTAFNETRDWFVSEFLDEEELLRRAIAQLLQDQHPQKWIIRTVLGYASKDYQAGRERFHELMDEWPGES
ncbi:hypothetical protein [Spirulina subsalsa]|uniref:hypothetical protein n=1 Tax=Spirulina subsalsa TaxID=54311 RepID=UPI000309D77A|nr:hypothetical protein [Spirulina subsalsa]